jgi:predicted RND superfamily exporter protein
MQRICGLERFVASRQHLEVGGVLGLCDRIATTNFMVHALKEERRSLPETAEAALKLWQSYELLWGARRRGWVMDDDHTRCLITVFMRNANYRDVKELLHQIREYEHDHLASHGLALKFGGDVACSQAMIGSIVSAQIRSLVASLLGILVVTVLLSRSLAWGVLCVLPCGLALLVNFAFMGAFGLPLGVATSMFASMSLGLGVDYAIHLTERYRALRRAEKGGVAAIVEAVATAGPAIMTDALAVALGFAVLIASAVPANAKLGALVVLSVLSTLLWTLVLLPALLSMGLSRRGPDLAQVHTGP